MKIIKYFSIAFVILLGFAACTLPDNVNPKRPTDVPSGTLFTNAQLSLANQVNTSNINVNISRLMIQYWQETTYFNESRYDFQDRGISDGYADAFYRNALMDFKEAKKLLNEEELTGILASERDNKVAIIDILEVYGYQCLVDAFGNTPYSEALLGAENSLPAYDDAATIYYDLLNRISADINALNVDFGAFGADDLMYGGDVAAWKKFAASLKLRIGMRMIDFDGAKAKVAIEEAASAGVILDAGDNGTIKYNGVVPHVNTIYNAYVVNNRKDFLPTNTLIDKLNSLNDPRLPLWFTQYEGAYVGAIAGLDGAQSYNNYSNFSAQFFDPTLEAILIDNVETEFLLAEAVERGASVGGTAEEHYNNAITASVVYWGGTADDAATYLANPDVAYSTAAGDYKQKIGEQKWLGLYNRGVEAWAEWRRLDYPVLNIPTGMVYGDIPVRMPYPFDEGELNGASYEAAVQAMGGVDNHRVKLFWDVN